MNTSQFKRKMLSEEREYLENILNVSPSDTKRVLEGIQNAFVLWAASLLGIVIVWLIVAWLVGLISDLNIGMKSQYAIWIIGIGAFFCAVYAIVSSIKWVRSWEDARPKLREDLENGEVQEESLTISEVKRFQEPEHGGLIYFLRISDNRVLVLYDHESQDLGVDDKDPFSSSFKPLTNLKIIRAPATSYFIKTEFSGGHIDIPETFDISVSPKHWPEPDSWCEIPWDKLESNLSS